MTLSTASRADWIVSRYLAGHLTLEEARVELESFRKLLAASKQDREASKIDTVIASLQG